MDRWEGTKIAAGIGLACAVMGGAGWFSARVMAPDYPKARGYAVAGIPPVDLASVQRDWPVGGSKMEQAELIGYIHEIDKAVVPVSTEPEVAREAPVDLGTLLASADPEKGRRTAQVCMACHDLSQNGPNRIGPNLWGVVGRPVGSHPGFAYSPALKGVGGQWTYQELDHFLTSPGRAVPGTKMTFSGIRNPRERAQVIAFLASNGASKPPFPAPQPAATEAPPATKIAAAP
ncbi:c-type cytochrome [Sphingomonas tabacisoli]|uniref:C-type cytochrome n=1 Tax=Sphingomonas tabacisoli TaxID=2249466 RepID=A0ABW4I1K3_9SPHN